MYPRPPPSSPRRLQRADIEKLKMDSEELSAERQRLEREEEERRAAKMLADSRAAMENAVVAIERRRQEEEKEKAHVEKVSKMLLSAGIDPTKKGVRPLPLCVRV